jgi:hypothetical protein
MCARHTLTPEQAKLVLAGLAHIFAFVPRFNIGPVQQVPVLMDTLAGVKAVEIRLGNRLGRASQLALFSCRGSGAGTF